MSLLPVAQRRHEDRDHVQPEVQILAEPPRRDLGRQVLVGRGEHAHIDLDALRAADRVPSTCSCSTRSTLACVFRLMSPISSRKIVPPSASSNLPRRSATAPVNAPRTWPKSSRLDQLFRNRGAVDLDERRLCAGGSARGSPAPPAPCRCRSRRRSSTRPLVGAAIATCSRSCAWRSCRPPSSCWRSTRALRARFSASRSPLANRVANDQHRLLERQRLLDEVEGAQLDRAHRRLDVAVTRDDDDLRVHLALAQARQRHQTIHARQPDVEDDDVECTAAGLVETRLPAVGGSRRRSPRRAARPSGSCGRRARRRRSGTRHGLCMRVPVRMLEYDGTASDRQRPRRALTPHCPLPIHLHFALARSALSFPSSRQLNREPCASRRVVAHVHAPPCSAMIRRTIASPRPLPRPFVE